MGTQAYKSQYLINFLRPYSRWNTRGFKCKTDVTPDGSPWQQGSSIVLKDEGNLSGRSIHCSTSTAYLARSWCYESGCCAKQGRFATAGGTNDTNKLAPTYVNAGWRQNQSPTQFNGHLVNAESDISLGRLGWRG
jgi:hypothetical protein